MLICEISIILIYRKLGSVRPVQRKIKLPSPYMDNKHWSGYIE